MVRREDGGGGKDERMMGTGSSLRHCPQRTDTVYAKLTLTLPRSVEFHQHGLVLRCQVVEVGVPELEHGSARAPHGGTTGQEREADGGKEADGGRHHGQKRSMMGKRTNMCRPVDAAAPDDPPLWCEGGVKSRFRSGFTIKALRESHCKRFHI